MVVTTRLLVTVVGLATELQAELLYFLIILALDWFVANEIWSCITSIQLRSDDISHFEYSKWRTSWDPMTPILTVVVVRVAADGVTGPESGHSVSSPSSPLPARTSEWASDFMKNEFG